MDAGIWHDLIESASADAASPSFARLLSGQPDQGLLLIDPQGRCLYANAAILDMTGFSLGELHARPIHALIRSHRPDGKPLSDEECPLHQALSRRTEHLQSEPSLFMRKDGSRFYASWMLMPVLRDGEPVCMMLEIRDEGYVKQAALKRMAGQMTYRLAVEAAGIGVWEMDLYSDRLTLCPIASEVFGLGYRETVLEADGLQDFLVQECAAEFRNLLRSTAQDGEVFDTDVRLRRGGQMRWINVRGMGIKNALDKPVRTVGILCDITEKTAAQESWQSRELIYLLAVEAADIGTWELDFDGGDCMFSPIAARLLGLPPDRRNVPAAEWRKLICHEDLRLVEQARKSSVERGELFNLEVRVRRPGGSTIWIALRGISRNDEKGRPCRAIGVLIDITNRKNFEEALRASNQRLSLILESSGEGIFGMADDHSCAFINTAGAVMLGYSSEELIGQKIYPALDCCSKNQVCEEKQSVLIRAVDHGMSMRDEEGKFRRKDGSMLPVAYSVSPILLEGRPSGAVINFTDITVRKQAKKNKRRAGADALRSAHTNAKFRTFFEQGTHFAGVLAPDGTLIEVNRLSLEQCGYAREEVIGRKFWECPWWNRSKAVMESVKHACKEAAEGRQVWQEIVYFTADGGERITDLTVTPVKDRQGAVIFLAPTGTDITDRKRAEAGLRASEERFRLLAELSPDAILVEVEGRFVYGNFSAARLLGAEGAPELLRRQTFDFIDAEFHEVVRRHRALSGEQKSRAPLIDLSLKKIDGAIIHVQAACAEANWEGKPAVQIMLRDVTELKQVQDKLRHMSERLKIAVEGTGEGIWDWDVASHTFTFSGGLNRIIGRSDAETSGTEADWLDAMHPEDVQRVRSVFYDCLNNEKPLYECEYRLRAADGRWKWVKARGMIVERDRAGKPRVMTGTLVDVTARKESDERAWMHANLDALTSLPNRRHFRERLELELLKARRGNHRIALLFIDLDGFKQINDFFGHEAGDAVLMETAHRIRQCVRETDTVARLGGDEFTVILTRLPEINHVEFISQKILHSLSEPFHLGTDTGYVSGSIGISLYPLDADSAGELIRKADQAMYSAKHAGKNQFNYFTKEIDERAHLHLHISNELRHAMPKNQFTVHYQPVVSLYDGHIVKAEALLRWHHPKMGEVEPARFIPVAEESGLIRQIGNWVFKEATLCCKRCSDILGEPFQIGVNKSPIQFMARNQEADWLEYLAEQEMPGNSIAVEITEGVLLHASSTVEDKLSEYHRAGVEVALDDFGTGYSSMSYLQKFKIDYVKIDQSFVQKITDDPNSRTIAEAIIMMAHKLGQKVIAEGIETHEQLECLKQAGCDFGQGFYFSHPVPADNLIALLSDRPRHAGWLM